MLNARTDTYFAGTTGRRRSPRRSSGRVRYVEAGADCVFVPGVVEEDTIRRLAAAIPGPLNVVAGLANTIDAPTLFSLGVKRVSLGGSLARAALSMLERAGRELLDSGTLGFLDGAIALRRPAATLRLVTTVLCRHRPPQSCDLSTSTSQPGKNGSKPCSTSQRIASRLRDDHHPRITSRSTSVP